MQFTDPVVKAENWMLLHPTHITDVVVAMVAVSISMLVALLIVGNENAAVSSCSNVEKVEAVAAGFTHQSDVSAFVTGVKCLPCVFNQDEILTLAQIEDGVHIGHL